MVLHSQLIEHCSIRSAIVPYTIAENSDGICELWFFFGIDTASKDLTDFGGGVKRHENVITGGYRELNEETKGIFKNVIKIEDLERSVGATIKSRANQMSVLFVPIGREWIKKASVLFEEAKINTSDCNEIFRVEPINENSFLQLIHSSDSIMWKNIRRFYSMIYTDRFRNRLYDHFRSKG